VRIGRAQRKTGVFLNRNVFNLESTVQLAFEDIVKFEVNGGAYEKYAKVRDCHFMHKSSNAK